MVYVVYYIDYIHHLLNEFKKWIFSYNSDRRVYLLKIQEMESSFYGLFPLIIYAMGFCFLHSLVQNT